MSLPAMTKVESSHIEAVGHSGNKLYVRFKSGGVFSYAGVNADLHKELLKAESVGSFLAAHIKGKFVHKKVDA